LIQLSSGEGWGLAYDPHKQRLIVSDGSSHIIFYELPHYQYPHIEHDRQSLSSSIKPMIKYYGNIQRIHDIVVKNSYQHEIKLLNELEYVNGYLYANVWFQDFIVQIDLETGKMIQKYDFLSLYPLKDRLPKADYFNGIAYNKTSQTFLITGKLWPNYYEVKFVNRDVNARHDLM
jgi:glutamine cyclotransferase